MHLSISSTSNTMLYWPLSSIRSMETLFKSSADLCQSIASLKFFDELMGVWFEIVVIDAYG